MTPINEKDPAAAATAQGLGSNNPCKDMKMNEHKDNTAPDVGAMLFSRRTEGRGMIPKMNGWNILDFELVYDALVGMEQAAMWVLEQPRAGVGGGHLPRGADYLQDLVYDGIHVALEHIVEHLKATRYDDPEDERRRVWLIIKNYAEFPDPDRSVSDVLQEVG